MSQFIIELPSEKKSKICNYYNINNFDQFIIGLYTAENPLSSIEISEKILKETNVNFSPRLIQRLLKKNVVMRTQKESFQLAIKKGRVRWMLKEYQERIKRKKLSSSTRFKVFARDGYQCVICGDKHHITVDHKISLSKGGTDELDNLQTLCWACNVGKSSLLGENQPIGKLE